MVSSPGVTEANCTAQSRPPAEITWEVGDENRTLGAPVSSAYEQGDGTTTVTSTLLFQSGLLGDVAVRCVVHHRGLEKPLMLALSTNGEQMSPFCLYFSGGNHVDAPYGNGYSVHMWSLCCHP